VIRSELSLRGQADEGPQVPLDPLDFRLGHQIGDRAVKLLPDLCGRVALQDACLRLDHLGECPERNPLAVGQRAAAPPEDEPPGAALDRTQQLEDEPAFADSGHADEGDELRLALVEYSLERLPQ
jgi:hypothetical protein